MRRAMTDRVLAPADEIAAPEAPFVVFPDEAAWTLACRRAAAARARPRVGGQRGRARAASRARALVARRGEPALRRARPHGVARARRASRGAARGSAGSRSSKPMLL